MTEEEKKAFSRLYMKATLYSADTEDYPNSIVSKRDLVIIINLIEKQQQELQNLQNIDKEHQKLNGELRDEIKRQGNTREIEEKYVEEKFISKDKIRFEIEELKNMKVNGEIFTTAVNFAIKILKELLKEE